MPLFLGHLWCDDKRCFPGAKAMLTCCILIIWSLKKKKKKKCNPDLYKVLCSYKMQNCTENDASLRTENWLWLRPGELVHELEAEEFQCCELWGVGRHGQCTARVRGGVALGSGGEAAHRMSTRARGKFSLLDLKCGGMCPLLFCLRLVRIWGYGSYWKRNLHS